MFIKAVYTIRVVYKSGYTHDFDVTEFNVKYNGGTITTLTWTPWNLQSPIFLGIDDVAAVWRVRKRYRLALFP